MAQARLRPLAAEEYAAFRRRDVDLLAEHLIGAGRERGAAFEEAEREQDALLPDGEKTTGQYLFVIEERGASAGYLWYGELPDAEAAASADGAVPAAAAGAAPRVDAEAFLYDIEVFEPFRGRGFGRSALAAAMESARGRGFAKMSLSVADSNESARRLYLSLGFSVIRGGNGVSRMEASL